jgi:hypothetical protein
LLLQKRHAASDLLFLRQLRARRRRSDRRIRKTARTGSPVAIAAAVVVGGVAIAYIVLNGLGAPAQKIGSQLMGVGGS